MKAKILEKGDTIGIVSPASFEETEIIKNGINHLKMLGFKVKLGKHVYDRWGSFAGKDQERAEDLMAMFLDKEIKMILCTRGGYGSARIMPYLNFKIIKDNPKIFIGYSDITILLNYIFCKTNMITFHGPMLNSNLHDEYTLKSFILTLCEKKNSYFICNPDNIPLEYRNIGSVMGKLVGGNLCILCSTLGTKYEIDTKGKILFIEEVGEEPYRIDRMLTQLLQSGKLQQANGFILGQISDCDKKSKGSGFTLREVIEDRILNLRKPTVLNLMSGHDYPKITLPIGAAVKIDCTDKTIQITEPILHQIKFDKEKESGYEKRIFSQQ